MPSPFPGMDPYLEHPEVFAGLHDRFVTYLSEVIQPQLPEPYFAEMGDRLWVEISERYIGPDVNVMRRGEPVNSPEFETGGVAVATEVAVEPVVVTVPHDEFREPFLQIFARHAEERLVTVVEVLSLSNKTPGARGRDLYRRKQAEVLAGETHLVEIDLLRGGDHTTAVPLARAQAKAGAFDYHVCVHRFDHLEEFLVYPIRLEQRLPTIEIPLLPGDGAVRINLQSVFDRCYDAGPYRRRIRYRETAPVPPLPAAKMEWVTQCLDAALQKT